MGIRLLRWAISLTHRCAALGLTQEHVELVNFRQGEPSLLGAPTASAHTLTGFATHIELHRGLLVTKSGDKIGGLEYAPRRHSQAAARTT